ncbi:Tn7 transposase TnsA N-terminal domain-containing protein [Pontibacterium granulatum]|uniref:Tn7 transposase TnsA N-terminal domain-containing protein n=1 Tax=Pontibacterium granulatum TaxID=2036029 RepID=UPI002499B0B6|nr:Tn7 transposase TnsA N-terminal domain-containing protein [Pontibacterium granulatum]MDI3326526.1 Tn7 transposase TnsA N-terminal domain-containing protein [Pontibacterium granulatum]
MYRRNLKYSRVKNLFKFASPKMDNVLVVESALEYDACFHFEYSPDIVAFEAQPEGFYYSFCGKRLPYTPDFRVYDRVNGVRYIEVKPASKTLKQVFRDKFSALQSTANELGVPLILVTERQIRVSPILNNLKLLHRYSGIQSLTPLHFKLLDLVKSSGMVRVRNLIEATNESEGVVLASTLTWLSIGKLKADLSSEALSRDSLVWC